MVKRFIKLMCIIIFVLIPLQGAAETAGRAVQDDIKIIRISPEDQRAVIKTAGSDLQIIRVGDMINSKLSESGSQRRGVGTMEQGLRVIEIAEGRIVLEALTDTGPQMVIIRLEKDKGTESESQTIERISRMPVKGRKLYMPQTSPKTMKLSVE